MNHRFSSRICVLIAFLTFIDFGTPSEVEEDDLPALRQLFGTGTFIGQEYADLASPQARMLFSSENLDILLDNSTSNSTATPVTALPTTASAFLPCGEGDENYFRGYCYYFQQIPPLTWQEADDFCSHYHSRLIYVDSHDENLWLLRKIPDVFGEYQITWLGISDVTDDMNVTSSNATATRTRLRWSDGSVPKFINVIQDTPSCAAANTAIIDEPSLLPTTQRPFCHGTSRCYALYTWPDAGFGFWTDQACNGRKAFVCKRPASGLPTWATTEFVDNKINERFAQLQNELLKNHTVTADSLPSAPHTFNGSAPITTDNGQLRLQLTNLTSSLDTIIQTTNASTEKLGKRIHDAVDEIKATRALQDIMLAKFDQRYKTLKTEQSRLVRRIADMEVWRTFVEQQVALLNERVAIALDLMQIAFPSSLAYSLGRPLRPEQHQEQQPLRTLPRTRNRLPIRDPRNRSFLIEATEGRPSERQDSFTSPPTTSPTIQQAVDSIHTQLLQAALRENNKNGSGSL